MNVCYNINKRTCMARIVYSGYLFEKYYLNKQRSSSSSSSDSHYIHSNAFVMNKKRERIFSREFPCLNISGLVCKSYAFINTVLL